MQRKTTNMQDECVPANWATLQVAMDMSEAMGGKGSGRGGSNSSASHASIKPVICEISLSLRWHTLQRRNGSLEAFRI